MTTFSDLYTNVGPGGAKAAISTATQDKLLGLQGSAPPGDYGGSQWIANGVTWNRDPQTGQWSNPEADDPMVQKMLDSGAIAFGQDGTLQLNAGIAGKVMPSTAYGGYGYFRPTQVSLDSSGAPTIQAGGKTSVANPSNVKWDPNYGYVTSNTNIRNKDDFYDKFSGTILPGLIAAGMTAGAGALTGGATALGSQLSSLGQGLISGGGINPMTAVNVIGGQVPGVSDALPYINAGTSVYNTTRQPTNPLALYSTLAKLYGLGG